MKKINLKKYVFQNNIRSILFILKATTHGGIPDGTKKVIRSMRNKVENIRFILLSEKIPKIKETFDLVITDELRNELVQKVKKIVKFNRLLVIDKKQVYDTNFKNSYRSLEIPLTFENDLTRIPELQRTKKKYTKAQYIGRKVGHYFGVFAASCLLSFPSLLVSIILSQYKPSDVFAIDVQNNKSTKLSFGEKYSALSYNTGFAAYNQNMHFYMDCPGQSVWGGQGTAESKESVNAALAGIQRIIAGKAHDTDVIIDADYDKAKTNELCGSRIYSTSYVEKVEQGITYYPRIEGSDAYVSDIEAFNESLNGKAGGTTGDGLFDFIALQEQDINCHKSCETNQPQIINDTTVWKDDTEYKFSDIYNSTFALNFSTPYIPIPLNDPFGKAVAGLSTFSKYYNANAQRIALANITTFPLNLFELKRCLSMNWYPIGDSENPHEQNYFIFINAHLAAYDSGGNIRRQQLTQLNELIKLLDSQGYYYMIAADWNQIIPDTRGYEGHDALNSSEEYPEDEPVMAWDFLEFDYVNGNPANPNMEKDYILPQKYDPNTKYSKNDLVSFEYTGEATFPDLEPVTDAPGHNGPLTQYMASTKKHNYQAIVDNPVQPPVLDDGTKSNQWRYSLSNDAVYKDASMNDMVRDYLLPMAYSNPDETGFTGINHYYTAPANFYTTHAIPTLRNAGEQFRNEAIVAQGHSYKASIDGFLVSRNIKVYTTYGFDTNYKYSDHNPVAITFEFVE